jgi:four helix bundle protein
VARSYRELLVWQKAKALAVQIYQATEQFPRNETYGLTSQIRWAAVSVPSNIAEG